MRPRHSKPAQSLKIISFFTACGCVSHRSTRWTTRSSGWFGMANWTEIDCLRVVYVCVRACVYCFCVMWCVSLALNPKGINIVIKVRKEPHRSREVTLPVHGGATTAIGIPERSCPDPCDNCDHYRPTVPPCVRSIASANGQEVSLCSIFANYY